MAKIKTKAGDNVDAPVQREQSDIEIPRTHPRAGWAESSRALAKAGEDALIWPEFANDDDLALRW